MEHKQIITCPYCGSSNLHKNGHRTNGAQYWRCVACGKSFQQKYRYNARKQCVKDQIIKLTLNSSGGRDISRILKISRNTVTSGLKKMPCINSYDLDMVEQLKLKELEGEIYYTAEMDEFRSFVGNKHISDERGMSWISVQALF